MKYIEDDNSVTLSLNEIDLVENGKDEREARLKMGRAILEYSLDFYNEYELYSRSSNRKKHIPYIFKALIIDHPEKIGDMLQCQRWQYEINKSLKRIRRDSSSYVEGNIKETVTSNAGILQQ